MSITGCLLSETGRPRGQKLSCRATYKSYKVRPHLIILCQNTPRRNEWPPPPPVLHHHENHSNSCEAKKRQAGTFAPPPVASVATAGRTLDS
jgi:hypothetical protein